MKERDFQVRFSHWIKAHRTVSGAYELKICKTGALPFSRLEDHQRRALLLAKHGCMYHKIPDAGWQNPLDCFQICGSEAFVVVYFYERGEKEFFMIDIDDWVKEEETSQRKSLTKDRAREIGKIYSL